MTDRIDLDELDAGDDEEDGPNRGDWFWRGESDPAEERTAATDAESDAGETAETESEALNPTSAASGRVPRVPRENEDRPAGIPVESGGAGTGAGVADADDGNDERASDAADEGGSNAPDEDAGDTADDSASAPSGPHGGGADDMTLAFTYAAATRLANFGAAAVDADGWADWVGVVGRVPAHVLNKFQRDRNVDLDFFNGSARGPGERLAAIDRHSMFHAERTVVVGVEGEDEEIAERADWEFVPLSEAAEKAGWALDADEAGDAPGGVDDAANGDDDATE